VCELSGAKGLQTVAAEPLRQLAVPACVESTFHSLIMQTTRPHLCSPIARLIPIRQEKPHKLGKKRPSATGLVVIYRRSLSFR